MYRGFVKKVILCDHLEVKIRQGDLGISLIALNLTPLNQRVYEMKWNIYW